MNPVAVVSHVCDGCPVPFEFDAVALDAKRAKSANAEMKSFLIFLLPAPKGRDSGMRKKYGRQPPSDSPPTRSAIARGLSIGAAFLAGGLVPIIPFAFHLHGAK
jgi:VIT1/CCC1 family predicted Fe2+/Mn2+ transporter